MAVIIGHASSDENKKIKGGQAGDQTGKEVCTRSWYSKPWNVMLRPISPRVAEMSARACEKGCANNNIGYDQNQRNTLRTKAVQVGFDLSKVGACETDCSAFMSVCAEAAGVNIPYTSGNAPTTSTMRKVFTQTGAYRAYTDTKYLTSDKYLQRGDILVKEGSHTVMVLSPTKSSFAEEVKAVLGANNGDVLSQTITVSATINRKHPIVKVIQKRLNDLGFNCGEEDGVAGSKFSQAVINYQRDVVKATPRNQDGEITAKGATWRKLLEQ